MPSCRAKNFENIKHVLRCGSMYLLPPKFSNHLKICKIQNVDDTDKAYFPSPERTSWLLVVQNDSCHPGLLLHLEKKIGERFAF